MAEVLTLAQAKAQITTNDQPLTPSVDRDQEITDYVDATTDLVEQLIGAVRERTVVETFYQPRAIILSTTPVLSVVSVLDRDTVVSLDHLQADAASGVLEILPGLLGLSALPWFAGPVTVTYTVGRDTCPPAVRIAARVIFAHLWASQKRSTLAPRLAGQPDVGAAVGLGFAVPNKALELLQAYMVTDGVA